MNMDYNFSSYFPLKNIQNLFKFMFYVWISLQIQVSVNITGSIITEFAKSSY